MARFGQGLIQALTNPAYADKLNMAGMMAGSMPGRLRAEEEEIANRTQLAQLMQSNNPEQIKAAATQAMAAGDTKTGMALLQRASEMTKVQQAQLEDVKPQGTRVNKAQELAGMNERRALNEYLERTGNSDLLGMDPKEALKIATERGKEAGRDRRSTAGKAAEADWRSGFTAADYQTPEGLDTVTTAALEAGDYTAANTLIRQRQELQARNAGVDLPTAFASFEAVDPSYKNKAKIYDTAVQLEKMTNLEGASIATLQERLVSALTPNDVKAQAELERMRKSKAVDQRVKDVLSMWFRGDLSKATVEDYKALAREMQDFYRADFESTAEAMKSLGKQNEIYGNTILQIHGITKPDTFEGFQIISTD